MISTDPTPPSVGLLTLDRFDGEGGLEKDIQEGGRDFLENLQDCLCIQHKDWSLVHAILRNVLK